MQTPGQLSALRHPQFLKYWLGSFTSVGAIQLQVMGLGWLVYELSESALHLGYLGAAAGIPATVLTFFGGVLADRLDKRTVLIVTSLLTSLLIGFLAFLDYSAVVKVWHVIAITATISIVNGFDWPVRQAIFPALIEREDMMSAVALTTIIWQSTRMAMPALGGLIIAVADTWLLFVLCSIGYFLMFIMLLTLKVRTKATATAHSTLHQIREGIGFIVTERHFLILITLSYAMFFFASSYMQLMPAFADMLNVDERGFGYLLSITGIGAVTGTAISGTLQGSHRLGRAMISSAIIFCGFVYCFAFVCWGLPVAAFYFALATIFIASMFSSIFMVTSTSVMQLEVPDHLRGRVMGIHAITYNLIPLGALLTGTLATWSNPSAAISICTTVVVGYLVWITVMQRDILKIDGMKLTKKADWG